MGRSISPGCGLTLPGSGGIIGGIGIFKHVLDQGGNDDFGLVGGLPSQRPGA